MELQKIIKKIALPVASSVRVAILVYELETPNRTTLRLYDEQNTVYSYTNI